MLDLQRASIEDLFTAKSFADCSFSITVTGSELWNALPVPVEVRQSSTILFLKVALMNHFFFLCSFYSAIEISDDKTNEIFMHNIWSKQPV